MRLKMCVFNSSAVHGKSVRERSTSKTYEIRRGSPRHIAGKPAESSPLQSTRKSLTKQQAQKILTSTSMDLHFTENPTDRNDMRYLDNESKYIKSCVRFKLLKNLAVSLGLPTVAGHFSVQ